MSLLHYYNEFDPKAAAWLKQLIIDGHIPKGEVDERSIEEVQPSDVAGFRQCHFFAGISGWSLAMRLAGVPDDEPLWTGSCPCQPFSCAGKQLAQGDHRHLWPAWFNLIKVCRPERIFGEQVSSAIRLGWLDGIQTDLEKEGYAVGSVVLGAHSAGAPHIRQRLYWMAFAAGGQADASDARGLHAEPGGSGDSGSVVGMANSGCSSDESNRKFGDPLGARRKIEGRTQERERSRPAAGDSREDGPDGLSDAKERRCGIERGEEGARGCGHADGGSATAGSQWMGHSIGSRPQGFDIHGNSAGERPAWAPSVGLGDSAGDNQQRHSVPREDGERESIGGSSGASAWTSKGGDGVGQPCGGPWDKYDIIHFIDGKTRRIESGTQPLVDGVPARVVRLRGYGNGIVPPLAAEFIKICFEAIQAERPEDPILK